ARRPARPTAAVGPGAISARVTADRPRAASSRTRSRRRGTGRAAYRAWCDSILAPEPNEQPARQEAVTIDDRGDRGDCVAVFLEPTIRRIVGRRRSGVWGLLSRHAQKSGERISSALMILSRSAAIEVRGLPSTLLRTVTISCVISTKALPAISIR